MNFYRKGVNFFRKKQNQHPVSKLFLFQACFAGTRGYFCRKPFKMQGGKSMKKKFSGAVAVIVAAALLCVAAGCSQFNLQPVREPGSIALSIGKVPADLISDGTFLKSGVDTDTNNFILTIYSTSGEKVYDGTYGQRPQEIIVTPGSYDVGLYSVKFSPPKFSQPQFGDEQTIVVGEGEQTKISFMCRQMNAGIRLKFSQDFITRFPGSGLRIRQLEKDLEYAYSEKKYAYVSTDTFYMLYRESGTDSVLLEKKLMAGQMVTMNLSYSESNTAASVIKIEVDTARDWISYNYNLGLKIPTGALSIEEAKYHIGEKVQVFGYIIGGDPSTTTIRVSPPFESKSALVIAPSMTERSRNRMFAVELPSGSVRDGLNLVTNPYRLGCPVLVTGTVVESYFGYIGIKNTKNYVLL